MKIIISILTILTMFLSNVVTFADDFDRTVSYIFVAPNGNDSATGWLDNPLKTLEGARNKIREMKKDGKLSDTEVRVVFRGGEYVWNKTISLTSEDSGTEKNNIIYCSYPGENVVFTGGVSLRDFLPVTDETIIQKLGDNAANVRQINLRKVYEKNGYIYDTKDSIYSFGDELAMWCARFPNKSGGEYVEINPLSVFYYTEKTSDMAVDQFSYSSLDDDVKTKFRKYASYDGVRINGNIVRPFWDEDFPVSIDYENELITVLGLSDTFDGVNRQNIRNNGNFFLYNIIDELDQQGEYYIADDIMYIYRNDFNDVEMNITMFNEDYMITAKNTSFVTFRGITFENSKGSAAYIEGGENMIFDQCTFRNFAKSAVKIGKTQSNVSHRLPTNSIDYVQWAQQKYDQYTENGYAVSVTGKNHGLTSCLIRNTGEAAVMLSGGNPHRDEECGYFVKNSDIRFAGIHKKTYTGAIKIDYSHGIYIENNTLAHIPGSVINGNVYKMHVKNNDIYDGMSESHDNALIYLNYVTPTLDVKFENNYFHDVRSEVPLISEKIWPEPQIGAIAFDTAIGGGKEYINNVFEDLPYGIFYSQGAKVLNNVFLNCYSPLKGGAIKNGSVENLPLCKEYFKYLIQDTDREFRDGLTTDEKRILYLTPGQAKEQGVDSSHIYVNRQYYEGYENLLSLPVFMGENEAEAEVREVWYDKYPSFMQWLDITTEKASIGKGYMTLKDNLVINEGGGTEKEPAKNELSYFHYKPEEFVDYLNQSITVGDETYNYEISGNEYNSDKTALNASVYDQVINTVGVLGTVGAEQYRNDTYNNILYQGKLDALEYEGTMVVNINGQDDMLGLNDMVSMVLKDSDNKIIHIDQVFTNKDGNYNFRFKIDRKNFEGCNLKVYVAGRTLDNCNIVVTSQLNDVIKPEFSAIDNNGKVTLNMQIVNSYFIPDYKYTFIIAGYDALGKLCSIKYDECKVAEKDGLTTDTFSVDYSDDEYKNISSIKAYLWNSIEEMQPLAECVIVK